MDQILHFAASSAAFASVGLALRVLDAGLRIWERARVRRAEATARVSKYQLAAAEYRAAIHRVEQSGAAAGSSPYEDRG